MQKSSVVILFSSIGLIAAAIVLVYRSTPTQPDRTMLEPGPDAAPAIARHANSHDRALPALAPELGIWPGLPELATSAVEANLSSGVSDQPDAGNESATLLELVEDLDNLPLERRGRAALRIAKGWRECMFYQPVLDEKIDEHVEERFRSNRNFVTSVLAQVPEGPLVDEAVEELARVDPAEVRAGLRQDVLGKRQLCSGTESIDQRVRMEAELVWLRKAARLGNYSAQHNFLNRVFSSSRPSGQAAQIAEDKQLVLDIVAGWLQRRDLFVLNHLARFVGEGYFGPPDPVLGYAYAKAAILAAERLEQSWWQLRNPKPARVGMFIGIIEFNTRDLVQSLTASELAEAEALAQEIAWPAARS